MSATLSALIQTALKSIPIVPPDEAASAALTPGQVAFANAIAVAIQTYLNSVTVAPGQTVVTTGTATAQRGATTTLGKLIAP